MKDVFSPGFWTMKRRAWLYGVAMSVVTLLIALGQLTEGTASLIMNVVATVLVVGSNSMALANLTPDNVFKVGVELKEKQPEA